MNNTRKYQTFYIETFGCQMNEYDSALVENLLEGSGMQTTADKASADYLLINTCSVRQHAENRALANLSQYQVLKQKNPALKIALLGCMASQHRDDLLKQYPHLDLVVGPEGYRELPELLNKSNGSRKSWMGSDSYELYDGIAPRAHNFSSYIAITRGCNNFCAYCIVPEVRGRERSRPFHSILEEAKKLTSRGVKEITLIGQNVNSYRSEAGDFADILLAAAEVDKVERIRFLTSHPKDLMEKILRTMAGNSKIAPHLHLPMQSGRDRILKAMNRKYTRSHYLNLVEQARAIVPGISLTTDIIVGFPTESEEEFRETLDLVEQVRFDDAFTYRYSPRAGTKAAEMDDDVPEEIKLARLDTLIKLTRKIARQNLQITIGQVYSILIERLSKKDADYWMGKTEHNRVAVLPKGIWQAGDIVRARVEGVKGFTLKCKAVQGLGA